MRTHVLFCGQGAQYTGMIENLNTRISYRFWIKCWVEIYQADAMGELLGND